MFPVNNRDNSSCGKVHAMLSEYIDNSLSARRALEVEKHLAGCAACSVEVREVQETVQFLRLAPRLDTSDSFMAALHVRLDTVDPSTMPSPSLLQRIMGWLGLSGESAGDRRLPAIGLGFAAVALALIVTVHWPVETVAPAPAVLPTSDSVHVSIASSASSPFSDPAADNLEFRSGARSSGAAASF